MSRLFDRLTGGGNEMPLAGEIFHFSTAGGAMFLRVFSAFHQAVVFIISRITEAALEELIGLAERWNCIDRRHGPVPPLGILINFKAAPLGCNAGDMHKKTAE